MIASFATIVFFGWLQLHTRDPLVDLHALRRPPIIITNLVSILFGFALCQMGERGQRLVSLMDDAMHALFGIVRIVMYVAPLAAFGVARTDRQPSAQLLLLNRRIDWHGMTPRLSYAYVVNDSTIPFYRFHRGRVELSLTRAF